MINFNLPKTVSVDDKEYRIRYDFRVILEIIVMLNDPNLTEAEKTEALFEMFFFDPVPKTEEAARACFWFMDGGTEREQKKKPRLTDWEQDFEYIIGPVNKVLGYEARAVEYDVNNNTGGVHWWTFLSAFMEIGNDSLFSQIVSVRDKQARGKKLEKHEREFLKRNADIITIKRHYNDNENSIIDEWTKGVSK